MGDLRRYVFDIETNGKIPNYVTTVWCVAVADLDSDKEWFYGPEEIILSIPKLKEADQLIGHNIISYDIPVLKRLYNLDPKQLVDTVVISRLLNPDRTGVYAPDGSYIAQANSLEAWGVRLGKHKVEHEDWDNYSEAMKTRCIEDVRINKLLYWRLFKDACE